MLSTLRSTQMTCPSSDRLKWENQTPKAAESCEEVTKRYMKTLSKKDTQRLKALYQADFQLLQYTAEL